MRKRYVCVLLALFAVACKLFAAGQELTPSPSASVSPLALGATDIVRLSSPVPSKTPVPAMPTAATPLVINGTPSPDICTSIPSSFQALDSAEVQRLADSLAALTAGLKFPDHLAQENAVKQGDEWDANQYFSVLTRLAVEPGSTLDYVYEYLGAGGHPILYVRPSDQPPYQTAADFARATGVAKLYEVRQEYLNHIQVEDTPLGFLEYVLLAAHGGQFYLYWHDGYFDLTTVATPQALQTILDERSKPDFGLQMPPETQQAARRLVLTPAIELGPEQVRLRLVSFTNWGGFRVQLYTLNRAFPHSPVQVETLDCVPYDIGINF
jgi:hypothetical protein